LIALVAPRPVFITGGTQDRLADPHGEFLAAVAAGPVYRLLGKKDLGTTKMPAPMSPWFPAKSRFASTWAPTPTCWTGRCFSTSPPGISKGRRPRPGQLTGRFKNIHEPGALRSLSGLRTKFGKSSRFRREATRPDRQTP